MVEWVTRASPEPLAGEFCRRLKQLAQESDGPIPVALTGGSSAAIFYDAWAAEGVAASFEFYWSDERMVPFSHPDSNFGLAMAHLLGPAAVPASKLHPAPVELAPAPAADQYCQEIRKGARSGGSGVPCFPLILLGLGADGHTGSLFPGRDPFADDAALVRSVAGTAEHPHSRLTFTPELINSARQVWFVITGSAKAWAVEQLGKRTATAQQVPALAVDPQRTNITFFVAAGATPQDKRGSAAG